MPKAVSALQTTSLQNIRQRIVGLDAQVPLLSGAKRTYINFDNAASTPALTDVLDTINKFMPWYSSVHRGTGFKSQLATKVYDDAREIVLNFFGGNQKDHVVIFGKNTTEAINKLSYRLGLTKEDVVLVSLAEHHSNDLPWRKQATVYHIKVDKNGSLDLVDYQNLLDKYKGQVKLVAISAGSNVTGQVPDVHQLASLAHEANAQILADCAQLAAHRAVDIKSLDDPGHLDYVAVSAHKMYAPFGTGALIGRRDNFESGDPELCGGGTIKVVTEDRVEWAAPPDRDEAGSPNVVGAVAFASASALKALASIGLETIAEHEINLTSYTLEKLSKIPAVKVYGDKNPATANKRLGVISFNVGSLHHSLVAAILGAEWGIGVRDGCFCAHPYVMFLLGMNDQGVEDFRREVMSDDRRHMPGMVRVSFGIYNTKEEVDVLVDALEQIAAGAYEGTYEQNKTSGEFRAHDWNPDFSNYFSLI